MIPDCGSGKCDHAVANKVLYRIWLDMLTGVVPAGRISTFADLHNHVDANMYFVEAAGDVPFCPDEESTGQDCLGCELRRDDYFELTNRAQDLAAVVVESGSLQRQAITALN